ncbi:hypothetical protein IFR05_011623 [Cadophora sp. M221]|nr:hypothetical protein IFR05_011623 [Cadophora sp. M221]
MAMQRSRHAPDYRNARGNHEGFRYAGENRDSETFQEEFSGPSNELHRDRRIIPPIEGRSISVCRRPDCSWGDCGHNSERTEWEYSASCDGYSLPMNEYRTRPASQQRRVPSIYEFRNRIHDTGSSRTSRNIAPAYTFRPHNYDNENYRPGLEPFKTHLATYEERSTIHEDEDNEGIQEALYSYETGPNDDYLATQEQNELSIRFEQSSSSFHPTDLHEPSLVRETRDVVGHSGIDTESPLYDRDRITWATATPPLVFGPYGSGRQCPEMSQAEYEKSAPIYDYGGTHERRTVSSWPIDDGGGDPAKKYRRDPPRRWVCCICGEINDPAHIPESSVLIPIQAKPGLTRRISPVETPQTNTMSTSSTSWSTPVSHCAKCSHRQCRRCKLVDGDSSQSLSKAPAVAGGSGDWTSWFKWKAGA